MKWSWALPALGAIGALAHPGPLSGNIKERDCDEGQTSASPTYESAVATSTSQSTDPSSYATLLPAVPNDCDRDDITHLTPHESGPGASIHYSDISLGSSGIYLVATPNWTSPSVVLDHSARITVIYESGNLVISFGDQDSYEHGCSNWNTDDLIFVTFTAGCGEYDKGQRCYFHATEVIFDPDTLTATVFGYPRDIEDIINDIRVVWGSFGTPGGGSPAATFSSGSPTQTQTLKVTSTDAKYSLPTATPGPTFDDALDDDLGFLEEDDHDFSDTLHETDIDESEQPPFLDEDSDNSTAVRKRWLPGFLKKPRRKEATNTAGRAKRATQRVSPDVVSKVFGFFKTLVEVVTNIIRGEPNRLQFEVTQLLLPLPKVNCTGRLAPLEKLSNKTRGYINACESGNDTKEVDSPWEGRRAVLLYAVGQAPGDPEKLDLGPNTEWKGNVTRGKFMNIYCVDCGLTGSLHVDGNITITPTEGITQGNVSVRMDLTVGLGLGIHAQYLHERTFERHLYSVNVSPFTVGFISVGPFVSIGVEAKLGVKADGKIHARTDISIARANFTWDWNTGGTKNYSFRPEFTPFLEAEGSVEASVTLGLPVAINFGIVALKGGSGKQGGLGLAIKPAVKLASVMGGAFSTNFTTNGTSFEPLKNCTGISTELSVSNDISAVIDGFNIFKKKEYPVHSTGDYVLKTWCLGKKTDDSSRRRVEGDNSDLTDAVYDLTSFIEEADNEEGFQRPSKPAIPFDLDPNTFDGYWVSTIFLQADEDYVLVACNDGNLYIQEKNTQYQLPWDIFCLQMFEGFEDVALSAPGGGVLHYYNNTMSTVGVSRLRVDDRTHLPKTSIYVSMATLESEDGESMLVAVDPNDNIFYPVICTHTGEGEAPKIYLVGEDVDDGIKKLKDPEIENSVTNGKVGECYLLKLGITPRVDGAWAATDDGDYPTLVADFPDDLVENGRLGLPADYEIEDVDVISAFAPFVVDDTFNEFEAEEEARAEEAALEEAEIQADEEGVTETDALEEDAE